MRVMVMDHDGKSRTIQQALVERGCTLVDDARVADVILIDHDVPTHGKLVHAEACVEAGGRAFLYPHGASAMALAAWDGLFPVSPILSGNFVNGPGHIEVARRWGYPHPVIDFGWTLCDLKPRRATGKVENVLFAAQHPKGDGHLSDWKLGRNQDIFRRLRACPVNLTVRYIGTLEQNGLPEDPNVNWVQAKLDDFPGQLAQIDAVDVVVSDRATFSCVAISRGTTVVMFDSTIMAKDLDRDHRTDHLHLYEDYVRYPFDAGFEGTDMWELLNDAARDEDLVGDFRERFIGGPFDVDVLMDTLHGDGAHLRPQAVAKRLHAAALRRVEAGDLGGADRLLTEAVAGCVDQEQLNDLAVIWWSEGRRGDAESLLHAALALDPSNAAAIENLAAIGRQAAEQGLAA